MRLVEQISKMKSMMGIISESENSNTYYFSRKKISDKYITFEGIDEPFNPELFSEIILVNKDNPHETYNFVFGKDISKSKFRENEAYSKISKPIIGDEIFNNSNFIRDSVKEAFPKNMYEWQEDNEEFTEGLRKVYPYSNDDDWSVLNFFDTNPHRKKKLRELFLSSGEEDPKKWLVNFLKGGSKELMTMVNQQRNAIQRSDDVEVITMSLITDDYDITQMKGSKKDRYSSIDAIDNKTNKTYQIKTVDSVQELVDENTGELVWSVRGVYSRLRDYQTKKELDYIAYFVPRETKVYVFENKNYKVLSNDSAYHYTIPKIY